MAMPVTQFWIRAVVDSGAPLKDVVNEMVEEVRSLVDAESSSVVLLDTDRGELVFFTTGGKEGAVNLESFRFPAGKGITGDCVTNARPELVNDPDSDPRFYRQVSEKAGLPTRNIVVVPLACFGVVIGAVSLLNKKGGFTPDDLETLKEFAYHAGYELGRSDRYCDALASWATGAEA